MKNLVLASFDSPYNDHCVDIFERPDGSFGYEEFRRDVEDQGAWHSLARHSHKIFAGESEALASAKECVTWLSESEAFRRYFNRLAG